MKRFLILLFSASLLFWASGCRKPGSIHGNGSPVTETRTMVSFNEVLNDIFFYVYIVPDTVYKVEIDAESNIIPFIRTVVNGNKLIISSHENISVNYPVTIRVHTKNLKHVELNGSGWISIDSVTTDNLRVELNGSGTITGKFNTYSLSTNCYGSGDINFIVDCTNIEAETDGSGDINLMGKCEKGIFTISGSGDINAFDFIQKKCEAKIQGSGDMYVNVTDLLNVNIYGSGSVFYMGNPVLNVNIQGSGSVIKH